MLVFGQKKCSQDRDERSEDGGSDAFDVVHCRNVSRRAVVHLTTMFKSFFFSVIRTQTNKLERLPWQMFSVLYKICE
jgi:hypothetical protein